MNIKKTIFYTAARSAYVAALHAVCDRRRRPYLEPLRVMLAGLSGDGKESGDEGSNEYMPEFSGADSVGDPYRKGEVFYRHLIGHFQ